MGNWATKSKPRKSDRRGSHVEPSRIGMTTDDGYFAFRRDVVARQERLRAAGFEPWSTASRLCGCGNPALYVWMNVGYCKRCRPRTVLRARQVR